MSLIEKFEFEGPAHGPHILLTARIHGNEPAGEFALKRLIGRLTTHDLELKSGKLTIMPCCNPEATKANKRYIDVNLNRIISPALAEEYKDTNEGPLALELMKAIDDCSLSIDLHSTTEAMEPSVICVDDQNLKARDLAEHSGIRNIQCDSPHISAEGTQMLLHYARQNNKPAILIECGQHDEQDTVETAFNATINLLISNQLIDGRMSDSTDHQFMVIRSALQNVKGEELVFPLMDKDEIKRGDELFKMKDGTIIRADLDGTLYMRNENTPVGEAYAYICEKIDGWP